MLELMELKNIAIAIPLLTLLVGIVGFLSNLGYRSILSSYPIFLEKNIKITSSFVLLSIVIIIILLNSLFYEISKGVCCMVVGVAFIYLTIQSLFQKTINKIINHNKVYKEKGKKIVYIFFLGMIMLIISSILFIFIKFKLYSNVNIGPAIIFVVILFMLIISGGYIPVLSYLNNLKKVTIIYKEEEGKLHGFKCYWISQVDDWIVVKKETGEVNYLKKDRVIKMKLEQ